MELTQCGVEGVHYTDGNQVTVALTLGQLGRQRKGREEERRDRAGQNKSGGQDDNLTSCKGGW